MENSDENKLYSDRPPSPQPSIYFDKKGKPLFGTSKPSAFSYAHPWPPIPTNLAKKQVLRSDERDEALLRRTSSADGKELFKPKNPKNSSDIELALYWDRAPYWKFNLPKSMNCPVHGQVETLLSPNQPRPSTPIIPSSPQIQREHSGNNYGNNNNVDYNHHKFNKKIQIQSPEFESVGSVLASRLNGVHMNNKNNYHRRSVSASFAEPKINGHSHSHSGSSGSERERNRERNMTSEHFIPGEMMMGSYEENQGRNNNNNNNNYFKDMLNGEGHEVEDGSLRKMRENLFMDKTDPFPNDPLPLPPMNGHGEMNEANLYSHHRPQTAIDNENQYIPNPTPTRGQTPPRYNYKEDERAGGDDEFKCVTTTQPPMIVRSASSRSNKSIQVAENNNGQKIHATSSSNLCPLHGSYLSGTRRRNTERFRTVVMKKDEEVQADLQITGCQNEHMRRRKPPSDLVRKSVGNYYSQRNLFRFPKSAKKESGKSEYGENYTDPIIVAESKKRNRSTATCSISNRSFHKHNNM